MEHELIVFDWDGTLMDSAARIVASMRHAFAALGLSVPAPEAIRNVIGLGLEQAISTVCPGADASLRASLIGLYRECYLVGDSTPTPLYDGAAALIRRLHKGGRLLAIATGKSRPGLAKALTECGLGPYFAATRTADDTFSKPHPAMLLELMDELGADRRATVMIGDTEYDLEMARNAGVASVGVAWGMHPPERLQQHGPLACARTMDELTGWLTGRVPLPD